MTKTNSNSKTKPKKIFFLIVVLFLGSAIVYLSIDYYGPSEISLKQDNAFGLSCLRAKDLIVQEYDADDNLWATRGMIIYRLMKGESNFKRVAHVPTGFSIYWLRNFSIFRRLTVRPECIEMVVTKSGDICALSAGRFWYLPADNKKFRETLRLVNYGFGDQGIRNCGITIKDDNSIFWGEYFQNPDVGEVKIYKSKDNNSSWEVAYQFQKSQIRHIHAVQNDPYTGKLWVCTGDADPNSLVAWSNDDFNSISTIGDGSQQWKICQLVFTEEAVYWGTDTSSEDIAGIYRLDKKTSTIEKLLKIDGAIFYGTRLSNGTIVMSTTRQGWTNEIDLKTRLYIINKEKEITSLDCGTWNHHKPGFWFKYAKLRFQRNQGGPSLVITCLNQKEFPDGDLLIISESSLLSTLHTTSSK